MCGCTAAVLGLEGVDIERVESLAQGYVVKVRLRRRRDADPVKEDSLARWVRLSFVPQRCRWKESGRTVSQRGAESGEVGAHDAAGPPRLAAQENDRRCRKGGAAVDHDPATGRLIYPRSRT